jgi:hypothetical protein
VRGLRELAVYAHDAQCSADFWHRYCSVCRNTYGFGVGQHSAAVSPWNLRSRHSAFSNHVIDRFPTRLDLLSATCLLQQWHSCLTTICRTAHGKLGTMPDSRGLKLLQACTWHASHMAMVPWHSLCLASNYIITKGPGSTRSGTSVDNAWSQNNQTGATSIGMRVDAGQPMRMP